MLSRLSLNFYCRVTPLGEVPSGLEIISDMYCATYHRVPRIRRYLTNWLRPLLKRRSAEGAYHAAANVLRKYRGNRQ